MISEYIKEKIMKKCLVFGLSSQYAGVESFIFNYIENMERINENIKFEFLLFDKIPEYLSASFLESHEVHIVPTRTMKPIAYYNGLKQIIKKGHYDIIWYNVCTLSDITLLKVAKKYGVSCRIVHSHNSENMGGKIAGILHNIHKREIEKVATHFFACSRVAGEFMFPEKVSKNEMKVVKNAIPVKKYIFDLGIRKRIREILGIRDELVIGHIGRFHFQKNHDFILDVFDELLSLHANSKLLLIGEGPLKQNIIDKSKNLKIYDKIIFLEKRADVHELLQAMDVFIFPSRFEGLGIALIEAEASDLPCVIADTIPREARLINKIKVLSLDKSPVVWAKTVLEASKKSIRNSQEDIFKEKGYDVTLNAKMLSDTFNNII